MQAEPQPPTGTVKRTWLRRGFGRQAARVLTAAMVEPTGVATIGSSAVLGRRLPRGIAMALHESQQFVFVRDRPNQPAVETGKALLSNRNTTGDAQSGEARLG